jgi:ribosomal protein S12 methylthiotransferase
MEEQVPESVKRERFQAVMEVQRDIAAAHQQAFLGRRIEVLVEGASAESEHLLAGRNAQQAPEIDGITYINEIAIEGEPDAAVYPGEIVTIEVSDAGDYDLVGRVVARDARPRRPVAARKLPDARSGLRVLG